MFISSSKTPCHIPDCVYDFSNVVRIDLAGLSGLLGIHMPACQVAARKNQPEGMVDLYLTNEHQGRFTPKDRVLILPNHIASAFAPQGDYSDFLACVQDVRAYRSNLVVADPFYAFMLHNAGSIHLARADDITDRLINFGGRPNGYLSLMSSSGIMH